MTTKFQSTGTLLNDACAKYIEHITPTAKPSTVGTVKRTLDLLVEVMGEEKQVEKILAVHVNSFYASEQATMLKGKPRAAASVLQIRRIVRAAIVWWHENGLIEKLPLPAAEKVIQEKHENAQAKKQEKLEKKAAKASSSSSTSDATPTDAGQPETSDSTDDQPAE